MEVRLHLQFKLFDHRTNIDREYVAENWQFDVDPNGILLHFFRLVVSPVSKTRSSCLAGVPS